MVSVIIPTFQEEENINELVPYLLGCEQSASLEIIICDATPDYFFQYPNVDHHDIRFVKSPKASRSFQLHYGATLASHDILYFLHADARPPKKFLLEIINSIKNGYHFGIFSYQFNSNNFLLKLNAFFTRYDGLFAGGGDQSLFIKKEVYNILGGFNTGLRIMEDFDFFKRAKKSKYRYVIIRKPLLISARKYQANNWLKVNFINLRIFTLYLLKGSEERMIRLNRKLSKGNEHIKKRVR